MRGSNLQSDPELDWGCPLMKHGSLLCVWWELLQTDTYQPGLQCAGKHRSVCVALAIQPGAPHPLPPPITAPIFEVSFEISPQSMAAADRKRLHISQQAFISGQLAASSSPLVCILAKGNDGGAVREALVLLEVSINRLTELSEHHTGVSMSKQTAMLMVQKSNPDVILVMDVGSF